VSDLFRRVPCRSDESLPHGCGFAAPISAPRAGSGATPCRPARRGVHRFRPHQCSPDGGTRAAADSPSLETTANY